MGWQKVNLWEIKRDKLLVLIWQKLWFILKVRAKRISMSGKIVGGQILILYEALLNGGGDKADASDMKWASTVRLTTRRRSRNSVRQEHYMDDHVRVTVEPILGQQHPVPGASLRWGHGDPAAEGFGGVQVGASRNLFGPHRRFFALYQVRGSDSVESKCPLHAGKQSWVYGKHNVPPRILPLFLSLDFLNQHCGQHS